MRTNPLPSVVSLVALCLWAATAFGDTARLITFGPDAERHKGDDDFREIVYIRVPQSFSQRLYLRIFDPDVGGAEDEPTGPWNTRTRFSLLGGQGAYSATKPSAEKMPPPSATIATVLAEEVFGEDPLTDGKWHTLGSFLPEQGEAVDEHLVFALVVEGLEGDDGNLFDVAVSTDPGSNRPPAEVSLVSYQPTFTVPPGSKQFAEARFLIPAGTTGLTVRSFDPDSARMYLEMPFVEAFRLRAAANGRWIEDRVALESTQRPTAANDYRAW